MSSRARALAVLVAAGRSVRMGGEQRKVWVELEGRPLFAHALAALAGAPSVVKIVVIAHREDVLRIEAYLERHRELKKVEVILPGGAERIDSVRTGAGWPCDGIDVVLIHDASRPLVSTAAVEQVVQAALEHGAALLARPVVDTLKRSSDGKNAHETVAREGLWAAQTPQAFHALRFRELVARAQEDEFRPTDDAALWERYVGPVVLVPGEVTNLKITHPDDVELARAFLQARTAKQHAR